MVRRRARTTRKIESPEHDMQKAFFEWLNLVHPEEDEVTFAVPNGVRCSKSQAVKLKAEGLKAGIPDVFMGVPRGTFPGLFIEFKIKPNKPSEAQKSKIASFKSRGYRCEVIYNIDDAMNLVNEYVGF